MNNAICATIAEINKARYHGTLFFCVIEYTPYFLSLLFLILLAHFTWDCRAALSARIDLMAQQIKKINTMMQMPRRTMGAWLLLIPVIASQIESKDAITWTIGQLTLFSIFIT
ncbi:hypothetical protein M3M35_04595 [Fructilactobacillus myrtifloralis]|uniref:Uncharacterized protein n=1 Tax=Fructilactobacillus myrtifloralis TaxID=2940301 RepID=A0ABY5BLP2_9LACO|nr:hypothetical protein [Fructilactobacillus myrtifloralis]USS84598.1 hypothetical protein M3M35_04595 [Fructilactobacillus myrtifloralis]